MGARLIAMGLLGIALALPAACSAVGWSSPKRVATASADSLVLPYYVQSPNGRRTDLVVGTYGSPDSVYPMRPNGRFARPWRIPRKFEPSDADIAMNDAGSTVLAWAVDRPNPHPDDRLDPCWCEVHALVRRPDGRFTAARKLTDAAELSYFLTAIAPGGSATVFTSYWHPEVTQTPLSVAEAAPGRPFGRARTILPDVRSFTVDSRAGKPLLLFQTRDGEQAELAPPYTTPSSVGALPGGGWFDSDFLSGQAFAGDGHGHELLFDSEIAVSARAPGGTFGELHKLATPAPGDECAIRARMNRRIAVVGWNCGDEETGTVQVAVSRPVGDSCRSRRSSASTTAAKLPTWRSTQPATGSWHGGRMSRTSSSR